MSIGAMENGMLDFSGKEERSGFRLHRLEVYNWGTFNSKVRILEPGGDNALLTGDIGSAKSTLVDAVTTLLVSSHRIGYNKAAGAESRERTLRSYVLGHYKSERCESGASAKPVALRDHNNYSVIIGVFRNEGFVLDVTLAQVFFWTKDAQGPPARFYIAADRSMSIAADFTGFGANISDLKKRLRGMSGVELFETFQQYAAAFRRRFGIENDQALELFLQTVSMKSVGSLTDFVREHMLEAFDVESRISALIHHFDDLSRAHEAVLKTKDQVERLLPLVADCARFDELTAQIGDWRNCRDALKPYFAFLKADLLEKRLINLKDEHQRLSSRVRALTETRGLQQELRACTEGALTGSEDAQYSEAKFLQVKGIIERFRGREGNAELDRRWTRKVTDVRQWFVFAASERWREDDSDHEHYTDSGGKSGGQKEKLAYTVLAASLAYQFGLEWGAVRSRSFRFVVIDEAFGRGSDESARFGLELFKKLNLQLLIVTPLQKIHIIEPFVSSVGFVHNEDGRDSQLRNLTIAEYRAERDARLT